jgi:hypothetical protein
VLGSNFGQDTNYPEVFVGFPQSFHVNIIIVSIHFAIVQAT